MKKKCLTAAVIGCMAMVFTMIFMMAAAVSAEEMQTGSIHLQLPQEAQGVEMKLYSIGKMEEDYFVYNEDFAGSDVEILNLNDTAQAQEAAEKLEAYTRQKGCKEVTSGVCRDGEIIFEGLEPALYLAVHSSKKDIVIVQPLLLMIPRTTDGEEIFDVVYSPKYSVAGGAVILTKVDEDGNILPGAHFVLQRKEGENSWKEYKADLVSGEKGQIAVTNLPMGTYRFRETKAPYGYGIEPEPIVFEIKSPAVVETVDGLYKVTEGEAVELKVKNIKLPDGYYNGSATPAPSLTPTETPGTNGGTSGTGGSSSPVKTGDTTPVMALLIILLAAGLTVAAAWCLRSNRKKKRK